MHFFRSVSLGIFLFVLQNLVFAQKHNFSVGVGASYSAVANGRTAGTSLTPYSYIRYGMHEGHVGMDIYQGTKYGAVLGFQMGYKYYCWFSTETIRFYIDGTLQYHKFAVGDGPAVPYNFSPRDTAESVYTLVRNKSFINIYGAGLDLRLGKSLGMQITISTGFNYCKTEYSPSNKSLYTLNVYPAGTKLQPIAFGRISAYYRIFTKDKRSEE